MARRMSTVLFAGSAVGYDESPDARAGERLAMLLQTSELRLLVRLVMRRKAQRGVAAMTIEKRAA